MPRETCDFLIIGSGAAGLTAAATSTGLDTRIVEKCNVVGGTTARSGGTIWVPGNAVSRDSGIKDDAHLGKKYLNATSGSYAKNQTGPAASRTDAFFTEGPQMVSFLQRQGFHWKVSAFPDYHPKLEGALPAGGRTLDPAVFDAKSLGDWCGFLRLFRDSPLIAKFEDFGILTRPRASVGSLLRCWWMGLLGKLYNLLYGAPVGMGSSLVAQLLNICRKRGNVRIHKEMSLVKLITENGVVTGGVVRHGGSDVELYAKRGVLLTTAGFAQSQELRDEHLEKPTNAAWSLTPESADTGIALQLGRSVGAAATHLDKLWGMPTMNDPISGTIVPAMFELSKPHSVVVDESGARFFCESQPYGDIVESMLKHGSEMTRSWLVLDEAYRERYTIGALAPRKDPTNAVNRGLMFKADTIRDLAQMIAVNPEALSNTVDRWNLMCQEGRDKDFNRGSDEYQQFIGDPNVKPNPNMGAICSNPFYAVEIYAGDAGNRGGLLTDEKARVLRNDGSIIPGLYAAGNSSTSIIAGSSPGAGVTLGPAMTFGYIAANHMMSTNR